MNPGQAITLDDTHFLDDSVLDDDFGIALSAEEEVAADVPRRILLIEDEKSDVTLIKRALRMHGEDHDVVFDFIDVPRLSEAIDVMAHTSFDLILLDLCLLDAEGLSSIDVLQAEAPNIPVIVYSGTDDPALREEALLCGASDFLVKGAQGRHHLKSCILRNIHQT